MAADYYPRLTAVANDDSACSRLVNEQARVGILLAGPGIIATLTLAPHVIALFYSAKFIAAVDILRWLCLGVALRAITWPMGYIIVARGEQGLFIWTELAWTIVNVGLTWILVGSLGVAGIGVAFFVSYVFHGLLIYAVVKRLSGFRWTGANVQLGLLSLALIAVVFCALHTLPTPIAVSIGALAAAFSGIYAAKRLLALVSMDLFPVSMRRLFAGIGLSS
jgi:PST family polysaccharide transporter